MDLWDLAMVKNSAEILAELLAGAHVIQWNRKGVPSA